MEWIAHHTHSDMRQRAAQLVCDCSAVYKIKVGRGQGDGDIGTRVWGLGTWGRETRDLRTSSMGRGDVKNRDAGDAGCEKIIAKVGGKCDISHFPREYVLVKATHPTLLRVPPRLFTTKTPCIEESETVALVFLLMEYWSPTQGRVGCGRQNLCRITAFDSK